MVLGAEGVPVTPEQLVPEIYIPGREGSLQSELIAAIRRHQRVPYTLAPEVNALLAELAGGHPVLVLQNLAFASFPRWHYAVLIGYDAGSSELILRSGREARQRMSLRRFLQTWDRAQRWAVVVVQPGQLPASADARRWIAATAPFETLGQFETAATAYDAAAGRWPDQPLVWQAQANLNYRRQDLSGAETALRRALALSPDAATRNNLAQVLLEQGCRAGARAALDAIGEPPSALAAAVADTRKAIGAAPDQDGRCNSRSLPR